MYGFVMLVRVFTGVGDEFVSAWRDVQAGAPDYAEGESATTYSTARLLPCDDNVPGALSMSEVGETQRLDILVTQQWLRTLVWRLRVRRGRGVKSLSRSGSEHRPLLQRQETGSQQHPFQISRSVLGIISTTDQVWLEAHGIGMVMRIPLTCPVAGDYGNLIHYSG
jgi:hypothetical protein